MRLAKRYGYQVIVVNRAGAGTAIGAETVVNANPDGYTVLLTNSAHAMLSTMNKNLTFDPIADFAPIELIAKAPSVVAVAPSLGVHNLQEFVALAKAKPSTINYGSAGIGTATHIAGAYFALQTGIQLVHVPYTVSQTILTDLLAGHIQATFSPESFMLPLLQDGKLLALAVSDKEPVTRADQNSDRAVARRRLHQRHLVRLPGAGQNAARSARNAARRHRRSRQRSRASSQDSPDGFHAGRHRAWRFRRLSA